MTTEKKEYTTNHVGRSIENVVRDYRVNMVKRILRYYTPIIVGNYIR